MSRAIISGPQRTVAIGRGLFLVHYAAADDARHPPLLRVEGRDHSVEIMTHPDADDGVLRNPGASLAVRALASSELIIEVSPSIPNGSIAASVSLEPLLQHGPRDAGQRAPAAVIAQHAAAPQGAGIRICGHVAGIGDVYVDEGEWIAGPTAPSRIEGIAIEWPDMPSGLNLRYAVQFGGPRGGSSPLTDVGGFAGTRRRALPLAGVMLELSGRAAAHYEIRAEALFLGSPVASLAGQRVVLSGSTGREPLVGLRVSVEEAAVAQPSVTPFRPATELTPRPEEALPLVRRAGRVRVFRNGSSVAEA